MMEKTETQIVNTEKITHKFYCDNCQKLLGESTELDDGYYKRYGEYEAKVLLSSGWYKLKKNLCDDCKSKLQENIVKTIKQLGFVKD